MALPDQLRRSLTWDQGAEMAQHAQLRIATALAVFFCVRGRPSWDGRRWSLAQFPSPGPGYTTAG